MPIRLSIFLILISFNALAQDTGYARKIVNELCSEKYKGRAYVGKGDKKAAQFIASEFKSIGLQKFNKSYFQKFPIQVNTFPAQVEVKYKGKLLQAGIDYLIDPSAPTTSFKGIIEFIPLEELDSAELYDRRGHHLQTAVLDTFHPKQHIEAAIALKKYKSDPKKKLIIVLTNDKLTWSSSSHVSKSCIITIRSELFDRNSPAEFEITVKNKFLNPYISQNVIGYLPGTEEKDSFIFITAHYDHLGKMGKTALFPGANDNASGIAMMLNLAKHFKATPQRYSLVFIAFSGEETGLIGSKYFVEHPWVALPHIRFLINIDLMGNGADGVMTVNGLVNETEFKWLEEINKQKKYLPAVKARGKAANSDHFWFQYFGVPSFFFYLMGPYPYYHDVNDKAAAVPLTNFNSAYNLFVDFIVRLQ